MNFFSKLKDKVNQQTESMTSKFKDGLTKTRTSFSEKVNELMSHYRTVDEEFFEELEDLLIQADVGVQTVMQLTEDLRREAKLRKIEDSYELKPLITEVFANMLHKHAQEGQMNIQSNELTVILMIGVNGVGKTTTMGKLAHMFKSEGKQVVMAAGDTFRAGAIEQLAVWGERAGVEVVKHQEGSDPAAVIYDAIKSAQSKGADILLCDTAGRLQNKKNLMNELNKIYRVIGREIPGAPHETLLVLDATTGQNAMSQAKVFNDATGISGIVLTKLDGTAKGGIVMAIRNELDVPVKFVGLGEQLDDLQPFDPEQFVHALFAELMEEQP